MYSIIVKELTKVYRIYSSGIDRIKELLIRKSLHNAFVALKDISFKIRKGETFGLIGENGAGKSTLLKLLAGTIPCSSGEIEMYGRVSALLELGGSFHPELSGKENIVLAAALQGLSKKEIEKKLPEIIAFSELDDETLARPVKTYSSGMFVRLGFSVATCISPDILLVDEALSVGDIHFQKKSLDRIMQFRQAGKTIIFCSHNMYQVRTLCQRALWLKNGTIAAIGDTEDVVAAYEEYQRKKDPAEEDERSIQIPEHQEDKKGTESSSAASTPIKLKNISLVDGYGNKIERISSHSDISVVIEAEALERETAFHIALVLERDDGLKVFFTSTASDNLPPLRDVGHVRARLKLPRIPLLSGKYKWYVYILDDHALQVYDMAEGICPFTIRAKPSEMCLISIPHEWSIEEDA